MNYDNTKPPRIIVLDNDECLGQFSIFSIIYNFANTKSNIEINLNAVKKSCIKYLFSNGTVRPNLKILFKLLFKLKQLKKIDKVVMYTSAPNDSNKKSGYIYFLKDCLETYCQTPGLYDDVIHRNNINALVSNDGATIKDLGNVIFDNNNFRKKLFFVTNKGNNLNYNERDFVNYVNYMTSKTLMIDDRPQNIRNRHGKAIGIFPYLVIPELKNIYSCIDSIPNLKKKLIELDLYYQLCQNFYQEYRNQYNFINEHNIKKINNDKQFLKLSYLINKLYNI